MAIVVTGGAGELGRAVIKSLADRGESALPASRRTGVDLSTGARLSSVLQDADVVVHCASHPLQARQVDLGGSRLLIDVLRQLDRRPHVIYISIVGVDRVRYPYYRAKYATEIALRRSGFPVTVIRATQFHSLVATIARTFTLGPVAIVPRGLRFQSVDVEAVAARLADLVLGDAPRGFVRVPDLAGPEVLGLEAAVGLVAEHARRDPPRVLTLPPFAPALRDFARGGNLPGADAETAGPTFAEWLTTQL
jgi:uncharacterized protein YbjT (DUF2867 family)